MDKTCDVIIIGGGPAGLSSALYAVRKNLKVLIIVKAMGGNAAFAGQVENYLGFTLISGAELATRFRDDIAQFQGQGLDLLEGQEVINLEGSFPKFTVTLSDGQKYSGKTVIIASGRIPRMLGIPKEKELLGKGVAICATCDAPLYKGMDVAVIGGGNSALSAAYALLNLATSVTMVNIDQEIKGDAILYKKVSSSSKVKILNNHQSLEILGEKMVQGLKVKDQQTGQEKVLAVQGVFVEVGYTPATSFDKLTRKDDQGAIMVDQAGATSITGIWAAGDVNNLWGEQMIIAAGEGAKTALAVASFLAKTTH